MSLLGRDDATSAVTCRSSHTARCEFYILEPQIYILQSRVNWITTVRIRGGCKHGFSKESEVAGGFSGVRSARDGMGPGPQVAHREQRRRFAQGGRSVRDR